MNIYSKLKNIATKYGLRCKFDCEHLRLNEVQTVGFCVNFGRFDDLQFLIAAFFYSLAAHISIDQTNIYATEKYRWYIAFNLMSKYNFYATDGIRYYTKEFLSNVKQEIAIYENMSLKRRIKNTLLVWLADIGVTFDAYIENAYPKRGIHYIK